MAASDRVSNRLSKVIEVCAALYQGLHNFQAIVHKENEAIGRSDLEELEAITEEKVVFGDQTSKQIQALQEAMDLLAFDLGETTRRSHEEKQLSSFVEHVEGKLRLLHPELESKIDLLTNWANKLKELRHKIFAEVETNAYLVQRLLDYHRETYAFWQAVARDSESGYGKTGKTKYGQSGPSKSLLTVRT